METKIRTRRHSAGDFGGASLDGASSELLQEEIRSLIGKNIDLELKLEATYRAINYGFDFGVFDFSYLRKPIADWFASKENNELPK